MGNELHELLSRPTISVDDASRVLSISRNAAYDGVRRGEIPATRVGKKILVLTGPLRRKLGIEAA